MSNEAALQQGDNPHVGPRVRHAQVPFTRVLSRAPDMETQAEHHARIAQMGSGLSTSLAMQQQSQQQQ
ncbi:MAG TPA: hypothetical protein VHD38_02220 [Candidatus Paceibacterota bacterium]|jgi:hypothetical protein|nr:hypothetical protein [Candidatus Paceibacterota bacterium]